MIPQLIKIVRNNTNTFFFCLLTNWMQSIMRKMFKKLCHKILKKKKERNFELWVSLRNSPFHTPSLFSTENVKFLFNILGIRDLLIRMLPLINKSSHFNEHQLNITKNNEQIFLFDVFSKYLEWSEQFVLKCLSEVQFKWFNNYRQKCIHIFY